MSSNLPGFFQGTDMPTAGWWEALWPDPVGVLAAVGVRPGIDVVDLCSGGGWFTLRIAKIARHVVAIDIDPDLLDVSRHRLSESSVTNCDYVAGDAYDLAKLVTENIDFVLMANAFHGVPDRPRLVLAARAVLKPGGLFAIINWHRGPREETVVLDERFRCKLRCSGEFRYDRRRIGRDVTSQWVGAIASRGDNSLRK